MKKGRLVSCLAIAAVFIFSAALLALAAQQAPYEITLKPAIWPSPTKTPVQFSHKKHSQEYKVACDQCHHIYKDGKNTWKEGDQVEKCEKCHTEPTVQGEGKLPRIRRNLTSSSHFTAIVRPATKS